MEQESTHSKVNTDIILERLTNLITVNSKEHEVIEKTRDDYRVELLGAVSDVKAAVIGLDARVLKLEKWQIGFVAKFSTYSALALFLGSVLANLAISFVSRYL